MRHFCVRATGPAILALSIFIAPAGHSQPAGPRGTNDGRVAPEVVAERRRSEAAAHETNLFPMRLRAVVYEIRPTAGQPTVIDEGKLEQAAASEASLRTMLASIGPVRLVCRVDQPVNVFWESILIGSSEPYVVRAELNTNGVAVNTLSFLSVGSIFRISAQWPSANDHTLPEVKLTYQPSALRTNAEFKNGKAVPGETNRMLLFEHSETLAAGRPIVGQITGRPTYDVVANGNSADVPPVGYVIRYEFDEPVADAAKGVLPSTVTDNSLSTNIPARFEAALYEVDLNDDPGDKLDSTALTAHAGTSAGLLTALNAAGKVRILYQFDQLIDVHSNLIYVSTNEMLTIPIGFTASGQLLRTRTAQRTGVNIRISSRNSTADPMKDPRTVTFSLSLTRMVPSPIEYMTGMPSFAMRSLSQTHAEPLRFGRPGVWVCVRPSSVADDAKPVAEIFWYVFEPPTDKP